MPRIAINGFGRIGRNVLKAGFDLPGFEIVAINDLADISLLAHLLRHDTVYRSWGHSITSDKNSLTIAAKKIRVYAEKDPAALPWEKEKIDIVLECTGRYTSEEGASAHLKAGARGVVISAPAKGDNCPTHVLGVNAETISKKFRVINNASCTTNCIAPLAAVMHQRFGILRALMTTIHSYTADQNLQDGPNHDWRRARAAAENIVPTSTGAALAVTETIPELRGLFDGLAIRVPTPVVSLSDCTFLIKKRTTVEEVNEAFCRAVKLPRWKGILEVTQEPLVSSDFIGQSASAIVDLGLTRVVAGDFVKVVAWYDNECGYSHRLAEIALKFARKLGVK